MLGFCCHVGSLGYFQATFRGADVAETDVAWIRLNLLALPRRLFSSGEKNFEGGGGGKGSR